MPFVFSWLSFVSRLSLRVSLLPLAATLACRSAAPARVSTLHDDFGRAIATSATPPRRIVSLNPTTTDILFAIGAGARMVGRSEYDVWPDSAKLIPSLGGALRPSVEAVLRAKPDLVILYASADNRGAAEQLAQAGIATVALRIDHLAQFRSATRLPRQSSTLSMRRSSASAWRRADYRGRQCSFPSGKIRSSPSAVGAS